ncbi:MAG: SDR family NAD(P)-dependent oxidoreductase, partial [Chloroflexota bacterium]|nr:SDR family NAD(P)-dependent oxidoreductase [Chloroflexota bacterium]
MERVSRSRTLRQVVEQLEALMSAGTAEAPPPDAASVQEPVRPFDSAADARIGRYLPLPVIASPISQRGSLDRAGIVVIVDDRTGVGQCLNDLLAAQGWAVAVVGSSPALPGDVRTPADADRLAGALHANYGPANALVHLGCLAGAGSAAMDSLQSLFLLAQALRPDLARSAGSGGAAILAAAALDGAFALESPGELAAERAGVFGFLKTLAQEWPAVRVKALDVGLAEPGRVARWVVDELFAADGQVEVGYRDGRRTRVELAAASFGSEAEEPPLTGDSVLLVTGGARGITAAVARHLAVQFRPRLVLVGRTQLPAGPESEATSGLDGQQSLKRALIDRERALGAEVTPGRIERLHRALMNQREVRATVEELRRTGAQVDYRACDVRDATSFTELIGQVYQTYGRIDGAIHGAGIIEDKLVADKALDSFIRVIETKASSALTLANALKPESLRFLVLFSSVAGRFGNRGQADYAAANEIVNKLAQQLDRSWPGRVVAINWGPWLTTGMVSPELKRQFADRGVELIPV